MRVEQTSLAGVLILGPQRHGDARGFFAETWNARRHAELGINFEWVQDNHSISVAPGTLRGLHFQAPPHSQAKLVRCGRGSLLDVVVDIRRGSPTYGRWVAVELSAENGRQLLIPTGFAHGFVTLEANTEIVYKCSDFYAPDCDRVLAWNDLDLAIDWNLAGIEPILSEKDAAAGDFASFVSPFIYEGTKS